jgi:DDE superfamily endonuclease
MLISDSKWTTKNSTLQHRVNLAVAITVAYYLRRKERKFKKKAERYINMIGSPKIRRARRSVEEIYELLGPTYFMKAYRMSYQSFVRLVEKISPYLPDIDSSMARVNGPITDSVRVAVSLRYFAGGSPCDIAPLYGIGFNEVNRSVWRVVDAVNSFKSFNIEYPSCPKKQRQIAMSFREKSGADFGCCAGAIDGILVWIHKPTKKCCEEAGCADGKFYCGRKGKFGLNCQAVCDLRGRFLDLSILYPGSTSDCLAFEGMALYQRLEDGLLDKGLCLFGDNAYLNTTYMATPYTSATGDKDAYNFFHSQLRIRIECAFGMFTQRWGILRCAIPKRITLKKTVALVMCLGKLHNYCIDERDTSISPLIATDEATLELGGAVPLQPYDSRTSEGQLTNQLPLPMQLMGGGNHFKDLPRSARRRIERQLQKQFDAMLPREKMLLVVEHKQLQRPESKK